MNNPTDAIREAVGLELARRRMSQTDLARRLGTSKQHLSKAMTGGSSELPKLWKDALDVLGLELTLQPKPVSDPLELPKGERDELLKCQAAELTDLYQPGSELLSFTEDFVDDELVDDELNDSYA